MAALAGYLQAIINMIIKLGNLLIKITLQAFKDLWELLTDVSIYAFDGMLKVNLAIANAIPVPDFMHGGMHKKTISDRGKAVFRNNSAHLGMFRQIFNVFKNISNMFLTNMFDAFKYIVLFNIDKIFVSRIGERNYH